MIFEVESSLIKNDIDLKKMKDYITLILNQFVEDVGYPIIFNYKFRGVKYKEAKSNNDTTYTGEPKSDE